MDSYLWAKKTYAEIGIDTDEAIKKLKDISISIHCWQGDDVIGFEPKGTEASGGIMATGNYLGRAQSPKQLMQDIDMLLSIIPGKHRLNLHANYRITDENVDRDTLKPHHFEKWLDFAKERGLGLDFNPTLFSHEMVKGGLTLSSPDEKVRKFWIDHCKACRKIGEYFGKELNSPCLVNIWIPDGLKDIPSDRYTPRKRLKDSLDEIYSVKYDKKFVLDSVESKLFGIGVESYTVGSHEFYMNYAAKNNILCLLDSGHFHLTESVADKLPSMLLFNEKVALHISRPIRWDSDHVISFNDDVRDITNEIVRCDALDKVLLAVDYFDASINRIAAWAIGLRNVQKSLLYSLLTPHATLKDCQESGNFTKALALSEELKIYPFGEVWNYFCIQNGVPQKNDWLKLVEEYEQKVLANR